MFQRLWVTFIRFAFHLFYNPFAFTYDFVSAGVSRGHWRAWTRAAIPHLVGTRILELPCGTGNLLLDLGAAGYAPVGVDLSASMLEITQKKMRRTKLNAPIARAMAQAQPFRDQAFDSIVMTFPPNFVYDPRALAEFHRVLADNGHLVWVDAGRLLPRDAVSRALDRALDAVSGSGVPFADFACAALARAGFGARIETVRDDASVVLVVVATKRAESL